MLRKLSFPFLLALPLFMVLLLAGCGARDPTSGPTILAAASLQESLNAVADKWADRGHKRPVLAFAASSALARQIENGAPADVYLSADRAWMDELDAKGLLRPGTRTNLLGNRLVLIAPKDSTATVSLDDPASLFRALGSSRLALANPDAVPAGRYAKAALQHFHLWGRIQNRIASAENVRAALALVERGEAPLGIVYATDAQASSKIRIVATIAAESHSAIVYPVAVIAASRQVDAVPFREYLASAEAQGIFAHYGFEPLP